MLAGWVFGIGGSDYDGVNDVAVDNDGNSYVTGGLTSTADFDPGPGSTLLTGRGGFVAKYSSDKTFLWVRHLQAPGGWPNIMRSDGIAVDTDGSVYVTGQFQGTVQLGDTTLVSAIDPRDEPSYDIFVSKLDSEGAFQWTVRYGGVGEDWAQDIAVDGDGDVYLTGNFEATIEFGDTSLTSEGWDDIFIAKLDGTDGHALWAQRAGSARPGETGMAIVASQADIYVAGQFYGIGQFGDTTFAGEASQSAFITKLDATSGDFLSAREVGEYQSELGGGSAAELTVDSTGNVYVVGEFVGITKFGQQQLVTAAGVSAGFLTKMDSHGNFLWALSVGGLEWWASISGVVAHTDGTLYLMGSFRGTADFDPGPETSFHTSAGNSDSFVLKLDAEGRYVDMWQLRGQDRMRAWAIGADTAGNCYVVGYFLGTASFPDGTLTSAGGMDGFLMKLGDAVVVTPPATIAGRHVFYNNSLFDATLFGLTDDDAIAPDKEALLPGDPASIATSANYTSFSRGINGIMVDIDGLPIGVTPAAADFEFRVGNDATPGGWTEMTVEPAVTLRRGDGVNDSHRITIIFPDNTIRNTWLEVTVKAENLGLPEDDVFYFGNAVAEAGNSETDARITTTDLLLARNNPRDLISSPADLTFAYDYDRDREVNATDVLLARNNRTSFLDELKLIDLSGPAEAAAASLDELAWLADRLGADPFGAADQPSQQRETSGPDSLLLL